MRTCMFVCAPAYKRGYVRVRVRVRVRFGNMNKSAVAAPVTPRNALSVTLLDSYVATKAA